jgi:hypothetical protein
MSDENQHWVPKFLIKYFVDKDGRVFCLDTHTDELTKPPPKLAASEEGFNSFLIDGEAVSFEDKLEKIETPAAPIIKRMVEGRTIAGLTPKDRQRIAEFMAAQSFRTKAFYEGMAGKPDRQEFGRTFDQLLESIFITAGEIARRHWALMVIASDEVFYLGDNPVVFQWTEKPGAGGSLGFDVEGVETFLPLSPKCALYMPCRATSVQILEGYETALELRRAVRTAALRGQPDGCRKLQMAQNAIRSGHELYAAFTTGSAVEAITPYVQNLNSLQCLFSHSALYSNRRDFSFARHVFQKTPNYRNLQKTSLVQMDALVTAPKAET